MEGPKVAAPGVKKAKKKQVKDEFDRIKQAEKKKRRLEKALATSAAIISELEKKKQKKKEEQERLDLEGAAIAEAVALHVLHGEDSDDSNEGLTSWDRASNMGFNILGLTPIPIAYQEPAKYLSSRNNTRWASDARRYELMQSHCGNSSAIAPPARLVGGFYPQHFGIGPLGLSADHLAAQAISSLKIADDARVDAYTFNRVLRG